MPAHTPLSPEASVRAQVKEAWNLTTKKRRPMFNETVLTLEFGEDKTQSFEDGRYTAFPTKRRPPDPGC